MNSIIQQFKSFTLYLVILPCFFLGITSIFSNDYKFKKIDSYHGLSQNTINVIVEDNYGLIWVGTNNGLNRLDGDQINNFDNRKLKAIHNSKITDIKLSESNLILSIYGVGIVEYDYKLDRFSEIKINYERNQKLVNSLVYDSANSTIWAATSGGGVFSYNTKTQRQRSYFNGKKNKLGTSEINAIEILGNYIYVGGENGNIIKINKNSFIVSGLCYESKSSILGLSIIGDKIFISSSEQNLKILNTSNHNVNTLEVNIKSLGDYRALRKVSVSSDSTLIIPTFSGVLKVKYRDDTLEVLNNYNVANSNFSYNVFNTSIIDTKGNLWLGSNGNGLYYEDKTLSELNVLKFEKIKNIPFNSVRAINSIDNVLWVGGYGGIVLLDEKYQVTGTISNRNKKKGNIYHSFISSDNVQCILFDKNNDRVAWLGSEGVGLIKYNYSDNSSANILKFNQKSETYSLHNVFDIDYLYNTLILSTSEGLVSYNAKNKNFTNIEVLNKVLKKESLKIKSTYIENSIAYISILGSTPIIYNFETGKVIKVDDLLPSELKGKIFHTNQILPYKENSLIIATNNKGMIVHNLVSKESKIYNKENGLLNNTINQVLIDKENNLWLSTNTGLIRIDNEGTISNFNNRKYELNNEYNTGASYIFNDTSFVFGSTNGITIFNPNNISNTNSNNSYIIRKAVFETDKENITHNFINNDSIRVNKKINKIDFELFETNTLFEKESKFRYRINNSEWKELSDEIYIDNIELENYNLIEFSKVNGDNRIVKFHLFYNPPGSYSYLYYLIALVMVMILLLIYKSKATQNSTNFNFSEEELNLLFTKLNTPFINFNQDLEIVFSNDNFKDKFKNIGTESLYSIFYTNELDTLKYDLERSQDEVKILSRKLSFLNDGSASLYIYKSNSINDYSAFIELESNKLENKYFNTEIDRIFSVFIDTILEPLVITNWNGDIMFANKEAMKFLEITIAEIPEVNLLKHLGLTSGDNLYKSILNTKEGLPFKNKKFDLKFRNTKFIIEGSGNSLNYLGRDLFIIIFKNITPQIELMSQLTESKINAERLSELKSLYISNLSHELKTPINAISGFTDLLYSKEMNESTITYLNTIKSNTELLIQLIDDLLLYSKAETGKLIMRPVPTNINSLVLDLKNLFQLDFEKNNLKFQFEFYKSGIEQLLNIDQLKLKQVLINIIGNSIKHTKNGIINLSISLEKQLESLVTMKIQINDDGVGIPKEKLNEIFTAFSQVDDFNDKGTGLGLAITKKIVDSMNGEIEVNSELNQGTEFIIIIRNINLIIPKKNINSDSKLNEEVISAIFHKDNNLHVYDLETLIDTKSKLNGKLKSMQKDIQTNFLLNDINMFARELEKLGIETNIGFIKNYATELNSATKSIEVEKINTILENFHKLELTLNKLIEKNYG